MAPLSCASLGTKAPFFGEFTVRHLDDVNGELPWHCGPFAYSLKLVEGPCIHHVAEIEGDFTEELREFCKFVPALSSDKVEE